MLKRPDKLVWVVSVRVFSDPVLASELSVGHQQHSSWASLASRHAMAARELATQTEQKTPQKFSFLSFKWLSCLTNYNSVKISLFHYYLARSTKTVRATNYAKPVETVKLPSSETNTLSGWGKPPEIQREETIWM